MAIDHCSELFASSTQVYDITEKGQKQTVGEFDFIFKAQEQIIHAEVAYKYYLNTI